MDSIEEQIDALSYSESRLIKVGNKKIRVTRMVYEYEIETTNRNKNNIFYKDQIILKLKKMAEGYCEKNNSEE